MSFTSRQPPNKKKGEFFGPALVGACLAVVLSVPTAAIVAAWLGDTYEKRALVYCIFLLWALVGAILIFAKTYRYESKQITLFRVLLWLASAWLWPLLLLRRRK